MLIVGFGLAIVAGIMVVDFGMLYGGTREGTERRRPRCAGSGSGPCRTAAPIRTTQRRLADAAQVAEDYVVANGYPLSGVTINVVTEYGGNYENIEVIVHVQKSAIFGRVLGLGDTTVGARAVARKVETVGGPLPYAIVALNPTACDAFHANGNPSITIVGGGVMVNSDCSPNATSANGNVDIIVDQFDYFLDGGVELIGNASITPAPTPVLAPLADPLTGLPAIDLVALGDSPDSGGTQASPSRLNINNGTQTLRPGVFWGGIRVGGNASRHARV